MYSTSINCQLSCAIMCVTKVQTKVKWPSQQQSTLQAKLAIVEKTLSSYNVHSWYISYRYEVHTYMIYINDIFQVLYPYWPLWEFHACSPKDLERVDFSPLCLFNLVQIHQRAIYHFPLCHALVPRRRKRIKVSHSP